MTDDVQAQAPVTIRDLVVQMLHIYRVTFTDTNSREAAIETWTKQFLSAAPVVPPVDPKEKSQ